MTRPQLCGFYWREDQFTGNLGDSLAPILVKALGYELVPQAAAGPAVRNPGRCLLAIGSLLHETNLAALNAPVEVWGCGWKGECTPPALLARLRVYAVRGPHTVTALGLPENTPLGDPALLLPRLLPRRIHPHGRTVVVPHIQRVRLAPAGLRCRLTGCDELVSPQVIQVHRLGRPGWLRQALSLGKAWPQRGLRPRTPWGAVERIAGAAFVLTGSLHGAILAQTYGVPWAAYDDGYVDSPAKWLDWAAYLGIDLQFVAALREGQQWWQAEGRQGRLRDLAPLLDAFPYPIAPGMGGLA